MSDSESACTLARIIALSDDETKDGSLSCVSVDESLNRLSISDDAGSETRVTVDHPFRDSIMVEDIYQDAIYPFTESIFMGISTVLLNFGASKDRSRFLLEAASDDSGVLNLAAEQIFTNVKASSGTGMQFLVHASFFSFRKDKVTDGLAAGSAKFAIKESKGHQPELKGIKQEVTRAARC